MTPWLLHMPGGKNARYNWHHPDAYHAVQQLVLVIDFFDDAVGHLQSRRQRSEQSQTMAVSAECEHAGLDEAQLL